MKNKIGVNRQKTPIPGQELAIFQCFVVFNFSHRVGRDNLMKQFILIIYLTFLCCLFLITCSQGESLNSDLARHQSPPSDENSESDHSRHRIVDLTQQNQIWSWDCNTSPCTYRHVFSEVAPESFTADLFTEAYGSTASAKETGSYIYIQAKDSSDRESEVMAARAERRVQVASGSTHTCALLNSGQVKCWGHNGYGQLGQGDLQDRTADNLKPIDLGTEEGSEIPLTARYIAVGTRHSCAILNNDRVKCWGGNAQGQLGLGDGSSDKGDDSGEMGDNLKFVDLGTEGETPLTVKSLVAGGYFTCALLNNDQVKCWGHNSRGQLGQGHKRNLGSRQSEIGNHLPAIDLGTEDGTSSGSLLTVRSLSAGTSYVCAVLSNGRMKCWGGPNSHGALGLGQSDSGHRGDASGEMGNNLGYVDLGTESETPLTAQAVAVPLNTRGYFKYHTCALLSDGRVKCWGYNEKGQLGQGHTHTLGDGVNEDDEEANELGNNLSPIDLGTDSSKMPFKVKAIGVGVEYACALLTHGGVKCWGWNGNIQPGGFLGQGHRRSLGDGLHNEESEMGDNLPVIDLGTVDKTSTGTRLTARFISVGMVHVCAILSNYRIKCWGGNLNGQLGRGGAVDNVGDRANQMGNKLSYVNLGEDRSAPEILSWERDSSDSSWNLKDITVPELSFPDQTIDVGESFSYTFNPSIHIVSGWRQGEKYTLTLDDNGGSGITYSQGVFNSPGTFDTVGEYTLRGIVTDGDNNSQEWSLTLIVQVE